jgi:electron transport complex protein RnfG
MTTSHHPAEQPTVTDTEAPVSSWTMLLTLGGSGAIVGLAIVLIYLWTQPYIERHKAGVLRDAIAEVLHEPARCDTLFVVNGALTDKRPAGDRDAPIERVFAGYGADGTPVGYAIATAEVGFADPIEMLFGYEPKSHTLLGLKILVSKETPGIADKIEKPVFLEQFRKLVAPLVGTKSAAAGKPGEVVMISGATISSRAVIRGISKAIDRWQPMLDAYAAQHRSN